MKFRSFVSTRNQYNIGNSRAERSSLIMYCSWWSSTMILTLWKIIVKIWNFGHYSLIYEENNTRLGTTMTWSFSKAERSSRGCSQSPIGISYLDNDLLGCSHCQFWIIYCLIDAQEILALQKEWDEKAKVRGKLESDVASLSKAIATQATNREKSRARAKQLLNEREYIKKQLETFSNPELAKMADEEVARKFAEMSQKKERLTKQLKTAGDSKEEVQRNWNEIDKKLEKEKQSVDEWKKQYRKNILGIPIVQRKSSRKKIVQWILATLHYQNVQFENGDTVFKLYILRVQSRQYSLQKYPIVCRCLISNDPIFHGNTIGSWKFPNFNEIK